MKALTNFKKDNSFWQIDKFIDKNKKGYKRWLEIVHKKYLKKAKNFHF